MLMAKGTMDEEDGGGLNHNRATDQHVSRWSRHVTDGDGDMNGEGIGMG